MRQRLQPNRFNPVLPVLGLAVLCVVFFGIFALDLIPGLRGGAGWQWTYTLPESWTAVGLLALVLVIYVSTAGWVQRHGTPMTLLWAFVGSILITFAVVGVRGDVGFTLFTRTVSPVQTGGSALAVRVMAAEGAESSLRRWTSVMDEAYAANLIHFTTSPPGQPLLHYGLAQVFDQPALQGVSQPLSRALRPYQCSDVQVMRYTRGEIMSAGFGLLMPVLAALAVFPLYTAARDLTGNAPSARRGVLWWALIPTIALFAPTWNTVYPALCVLSFALLLRGLLRRRLLYVFAAGVVMSLTTFLNFAVLPIVLCFGLFTLGYWFGIARRQPDAPAFWWTVSNGVWFGIGLLTVWVVFLLLYGVSPLDVLLKTFTSHQELVQRDDRLAWLILHPYDVALFVGLPLTVLAVWGMWKALARLRTDQLTAVDVLALSTGLMVLAVNLAGIVQGENGRILSFYAPFLLLSSLAVTTPSNESVSRIPLKTMPLFIAQAFALLVMAAVLYTVPLDMNPQPTAPRTDIGGLGDSLPMQPAGATFTSPVDAGSFRLSGYRYIGDPASQAITYELLWEGGSPTERPYRFELLASATNEIDGEIMSEPFRWLPQGGNYLTTCWRAGEQVRDVIVLPLPPVSMPVVWEVMLRAVDERTGAVMQVDGAENGLPLQPVKYP
jgi:hypothetical protein